PPGRRASPQRQRASRKRLDTPVDHGLEVARRAPVARAVEEELAVTLRTPERRGGDAEDVPAAEHRVPGEARDRLAMECRVPDDSTLAHGLAPHLELGLHQRDDLTARREHAEHRGQDLLQRDERDVDDRERRLLAEDPRVERPRVGLLHDHHAGVLAQLGVELAHPDVHGVHAGGAALEQAVGEAAGRGAHVEADPAGHLHLEGVEGVGELLAAPAHERRAPLELDARLPADEGARLVHALAVHEHLAREDQAGGLLPTLDEPALDEQAVDAHAGRGLGHVSHYRRPPRHRRIRNSSTIPARNPPMWANHAVPPASPPPWAAALTVIRPLTNWTTIQKPSTTIAGTYTGRMKKPKISNTSTRAYGNRTR